MSNLVELWPPLFVVVVAAVVVVPSSSPIHITRRQRTFRHAIDRAMLEFSFNLFSMIAVGTYFQNTL